MAYTVGKDLWDRPPLCCFERLAPCCESEEAARAWLARVGGRAEAAPEAFGAFRAGYRASPEVERAVVYLDDDHGETPMNEQYDQDWHDVYGTVTAHSAKAILRHVQSILDL